MEEFKYGMRNRPFDIGCQPNGFLSYQETDRKETGFWGILTYPEKLSEQEIYRYELHFIPEK